MWHCHTAESDGARSIEEVVAWYAARRYDFLSITDHNRVTAGPRASAAHLVLVPGVEVDVARTRAGTSYHLVAVGLREMIDLPRGAAARQALPAQTAIDRLRGAGAVVFVAHPYGNGLTAEDLLPLRDVAGLEVYNGNKDVVTAKGYSGVHWDECLAERRPLWGAANDDAHWRLADYGKGWTMLRAETLTPDSVTASLASGAFYASTGATLDDVTFDGATATVRIAAPGAAEVRFMCNDVWGRRVCAEAAPLREASHVLRGHERYLRIEVVGPDGGMAWTNPLFVEH